MRYHSDDVAPKLLNRYGDGIPRIRGFAISGLTGDVDETFTSYDPQSKARMRKENPQNLLGLFGTSRPRYCHGVFQAFFLYDDAGLDCISIPDVILPRLFLGQLLYENMSL